MTMQQEGNRFLSLDGQQRRQGIRRQERDNLCDDIQRAFEDVRNHPSFALIGGVFLHERRGRSGYRRDLFLPGVSGPRSVALPRNNTH